MKVLASYITGLFLAHTHNFELLAKANALWAKSGHQIGNKQYAKHMPKSHRDTCQEAIKLVSMNEFL